MDDDCDTFKEIPQPIDKNCHCSSSNKNTEPTRDKSSENLIQKVELDSESENADHNMQEYLDRECRNHGEQPLDCTLDFVKMSQPEREWLDYKPGIDSNQSGPIPETSVKHTEHQTDTRTEGNFF